MSLLRLLTNGKSLVGVKGTESRYRLTSQRLLPQFGPARNPFRNRDKSNPAPAEAGRLGDRGGNCPSGDRPSIRSSGEKPAATLHSVAEDRPAAASAGFQRLWETLRLKAAVVLNAWRVRSSSMLGRLRGKAPNPAIPRFAKQPVQGELSLDRIKVVRNDLSDADLEVVPARQPAAPAGAGPCPQTQAGVVAGEATCARVTGRIIGAGKT
jgi:hypothetical protein